MLREGNWSFNLAAIFCAAGVFILLVGLGEPQRVERIAVAIVLCLPATVLLLRRRSAIGN